MGFPWVALYGCRELVLIGLALGAIACVLWLIHPLAALAPVPLFLFTLYFFRDPYRRIPAGEENAVSPADGRVLEVTRLDRAPYLDEPCYRISIFLSVFDVHVNRSPVDGIVREVNYRRGHFQHAAREEASTLNECNEVVLDSPRFRMRVLLRQIAGAAARRIVFTPRRGDEIRRGQKIGMIKLGSRTELFIPASAVREIRVRADDRVKGGRSVVAVLRGAAADSNDP